MYDYLKSEADLQLPIVGTERSCRDAETVEEGAHAPVTEAVTYGNRFGHLIAEDLYSIATSAHSLGRMEDLIGTGYLKAIKPLAHRGEAHRTDIERDDGLFTFDLKTLISGCCGLNATYTIIILQSKPGQTLTYRLLLAGMDGAILADIERGGHATMGNRGKRLLLGFTEIATLPAVGSSVGIGSNLDEVERCIWNLELVAHHLGIGCLQTDVLVGVAAVGLTLIPDDTLEGAGHRGAEDAGRETERSN